MFLNSDKFGEVKSCLKERPQVFSTQYVCQESPHFPLSPLPLHFPSPKDSCPSPVMLKIRIL